jgi:hypothetical protein
MPLLALGDDLGMSPSIQEVKKQHEADFLNLPNVVSVGIGLNPKGDQAIIVGLDRPNPATETKIPPTVEGYPVVVQIVGGLKAQ